MDDRLLAPCTRALLEGWTGPVHDGEDWPMPAVCIGHFTEAGLVYLWTDGGDRLARPSDLSLDLSLAECRDRVARVLAGQLGLLPGSAWLTLREGHRDERWPVYGKRDDGEMVYGTRPEVIPVFAVLSTQPRIGKTSVTIGAWQVPYKTGSFFGHVCPALSALDPDDDTRLSDGSRFVDACALKLVAEFMWRKHD